MKKLSLIKAAFFAIIMNCIMFINNGYSQAGASINTTGEPPNQSAILDLSSTSSGLLIPRMNNSDKSNIPIPIPESLLIYNLDSHCFEIFSGLLWQIIFCTSTSIPTGTGSISGSGTVCSGSTGITYSLSGIIGATNYTWYVPAGASITSGQGTTAITVDFGSFSGKISVNAGNSSGSNVITKAITISTPPGTPGAITGIINIPQTETGVIYSITSVSGATSYAWSIPSGATITSQLTTSITVTFGSGSTSGNIGVATVNSSNCPSPQSLLAINVFPCGSNVTDGDGNLYPTKAYGYQCWTTKNLETTKYNDGTTSISPSTTFSGTSAQYIWANNNSGNKDPYGALYNWYAVVNGTYNLCPTSWHAPTDAEWTTLTTTIGSSPGTTMKESGTTHWTTGNNGTNASGFTALGGGYWTTNQQYWLQDAYYWVAYDPGSSVGYVRYIAYNSTSISSYSNQSKANALSVRCVRTQ